MRQLDSDHQAVATLTPEHALQIAGVTRASFSGAAIATLAERLQPDDAEGRTARCPRNLLNARS